MNAKCKHFSCIAIDALEFLQLKYEVDWPCNIVITSTSVEKYNKVSYEFLVCMCTCMAFIEIALVYNVCQPAVTSLLYGK